MGSKVNWMDASKNVPTRTPRTPTLMFSIRTPAELDRFMETKSAQWGSQASAVVPLPLSHISVPDSIKYEVSNDGKDENDKYEMEYVDGNFTLNFSKDWNPSKVRFVEPQRPMTSRDFHIPVSILKKKKTGNELNGEGAWTKNPDSWERRRAASISAQTVSTKADERKMSGVHGVTFAPTKQTLNQSAIFKKYEMDDELFMRVCEDRMRVWVRNSVVKPLADEIEKLNDAMVREKITPHIKIGHSTLEQLQHALAASHILHSTVLPYLLPYLRVVTNQEYLVARVQQLANDVAMREFKWDGGSGCDFNPMAERKWNEQLPTDSELIWLLFTVFMDAQMTPQSLAITDSDIQKPFSHTYTLSKSGRSAPIQKTPQAFYINYASTSPPHFELYTDGGRTLVEYGKGGCNLFKILVLFFRHAQLYNNDSIDQIHLSTGLNISRVFSSYI